MSLAGAMGGHSVVAKLVVAFGTEAQKQAYLPAMATGQLRATMACQSASGVTAHRRIGETAESRVVVKRCGCGGLFEAELALKPRVRSMMDQRQYSALRGPQQYPLHFAGIETVLHKLSECVDRALQRVAARVDLDSQPAWHSRTGDINVGSVSTDEREPHIQCGEIGASAGGGQQCRPDPGIDSETYLN